MPVETKNNIEINSQFARALQLMEQGEQSLFITGKAGTGKSTLLQYFCNHSKKPFVILAPTGVAALNVKGQTIHSFFHFSVDVTPQKIIDQEIKPKKKKIYKQLHAIIIDEVSMMRADLLDCVDVFLRLYGPNSKKPFGGIQMVFVGDLYQLPPVVLNEERVIFKTHYSSPYFFSAQVMRNFSLEVIELEKIYRQKDAEFVQLLNRIRNNSIEATDMTHLNSRLIPIPPLKANDFYIYLTTTNQKADEINAEHLNSLKSKTYISSADVLGHFSKEYFPTMTELQFKVGAQIMMLNNDSYKRWVNGSLGVIKTIAQAENGELLLDVHLQESDKVVTVERYQWEVFRFSADDGKIISELVGTFTQFPFRLAWAITIHKSQGKTFDQVIIDIGRGTFAAGQMYVALSRCTSFSGIILKTRIAPQHIRTDPRIYKFLTGYQYKKALDQLSLQDRVKLIEQAITKKKKLHMVYLKANDTKSTRVILPITVGTESYQGKQFPGLKAFCTQSQEERMFHVGRILKLELVE